MRMLTVLQRWRDAVRDPSDIQADRQVWLDNCPRG
jgi:hypothetical protein